MTDFDYHPPIFDRQAMQADTAKSVAALMNSCEKTKPHIVLISRKKGSSARVVLDHSRATVSLSGAKKGLDSTALAQAYLDIQSDKWINRHLLGLRVRHDSPINEENGPVEVHILPNMVWIQEQNCKQSMLMLLSQVLANEITMEDKSLWSFGCFIAGTHDTGHKRVEAAQRVRALEHFWLRDFEDVWRRPESGAPQIRVRSPKPRSN